MRIHIRHGDIHLLDLQTRMPFKYGIATMTHTPHCFVRLWVDVDGKEAVSFLVRVKELLEDPMRLLLGV